MAVTSLAPPAAHGRQQAGALLVCAYDSNEQFEANRLAGAISLQRFREMLPGLEKNREIIFYCA
ncbi:ArsR family transcriptional regulator [Trichlorobacter ammonificans]|uniref:ArsR family transcriptional regulator n=1 Tax=Trichlorobacter ammonificans TaxID=2916410 RepID=A0ABN8HET8_9BACT|nr:ArsR family transcriptional regulator [Trichlorobacter ammonificans]CAH2031381.1 conserved protein of unknown function [Trichlorobacter ammonificans]